MRSLDAFHDDERLRLLYNNRETMRIINVFHTHFNVGIYRNLDEETERMERASMEELTKIFDELSKKFDEIMRGGIAKNVRSHD